MDFLILLQITSGFITARAVQSNQQGKPALLPICSQKKKEKKS